MSSKVVDFKNISQIVHIIIYDRLSEDQIGRLLLPLPAANTAATTDTDASTTDADDTTDTAATSITTKVGSGKEKSKKKKARNALVGAAAGGAIASSSQGSTHGMLYTIDLGSAGMAQVVTDQTEIVRGDCVAVEKAGETANVRRISSGYCQPDNAAAVAAVAEDSAEDADECFKPSKW